VLTYFSFALAALAATLSLAFALAAALAFSFSSKGTVVGVRQHRFVAFFVARTKLGITADNCASTSLSECTECDDEDDLENVAFQHGALFWLNCTIE
jgi:hypothetical protein